jgi:hypothetical protein
MSHLMAAANRAPEAAMTNVSVVVTGTLDGIPERFTAFTMDVAAECIDSEFVRELIAIAGRLCPVVSTLRLAAPIAIMFRGFPIELNDAARVR